MANMRFFAQFKNSCSVCAKLLPAGVWAENEDFAIAGKCFCGETGCENEKTPADAKLEKEIEKAAEEFVNAPAVEDEPVAAQKKAVSKKK